MQMTKREAAEFFFKYGNVGRSSEDLLTIAPNERELEAACNYARHQKNQWATVVAAAKVAMQSPNQGDDQ